MDRILLRANPSTHCKTGPYFQLTFTKNKCELVSVIQMICFRFRTLSWLSFEAASSIIFVKSRHKQRMLTGPYFQLTFTKNKCELVSVIQMICFRFRTLSWLSFEAASSIIFVKSRHKQRMLWTRSKGKNNVTHSGYCRHNL